MNVNIPEASRTIMGEDSARTATIIYRHISSNAEIATNGSVTGVAEIASKRRPLFLYDVKSSRSVTS